MANILAFWIAFQLIVISDAVIQLHNDLVAGEIDCSRLNRKVEGWDVVKVALVPLVVFVPESREFQEYVDEHCRDEEAK